MTHSAIGLPSQGELAHASGCVPARPGQPTSSWADLPARALPLVFLLALAIAFAMGAGTAANVWRTGYFGDTDDAMRMVQVRDFMAGQGWFDLNAYRLGEPPGLAMHWSRLIDLPLAGLIRAFSLVFADAQAERAARLAFPALMLIILFWALMRTALQLAGPLMAAGVLLLAAMSGIGVGQFQPGRIDHHAPQIALLALMAMFAVESINPQRGLRAAFAAACAALSMAISIENLPFILALSALWTILFTLQPELYAKHLRYFGVGLLFCLPLMFVATIDPSSWLSAQCDAYSIAWLTPLMIGAGGCAALSYAGTYWGTGARLAGTISIGLLCAASFAIYFPQCLRGPLHTVDPFLQDYWLNNVWEARNLFAALQLTTKFTVLTIGPAIIAAILCVIAFICTRGADRERWAIVAALALAGLAATVWQIRAGTSLAPIACLGAGWMIFKSANWLAQRDIKFASIYALALVIPLSTTGWAVPARIFEKRAANVTASQENATTNLVNGAACFRTQSFDELKTIASTRILAPIDAGAHILALTGHSVLAAAYHRNNAGNKSTIEIFAAKDSEAKKQMIMLNTHYIAFCRNGGEAQLLGKKFPNSLAARLQAGQVPEWLEPLSQTGAVLTILRVRPDLRESF